MKMVFYFEIGRGMVLTFVNGYLRMKGREALNTGMETGLTMVKVVNLG